MDYNDCKRIFDQKDIIDSLDYAYKKINNAISASEDVDSLLIKIKGLVNEGIKSNNSKSINSSLDTINKLVTNDLKECKRLISNMNDVAIKDLTAIKDDIEKKKLESEKENK